MILVGDRYLHPIVYFVADKPTKGNVSDKIPLVGTKSYRMLLSWIGEMDIDITRVRLYNQSDRPFSNTMQTLSLNNAIANNHIRVIALGNKAMDYLMDAGINEFFVLPHPSGLNRKLNDKKKLRENLSQCRKYIYEGTSPGEKK